jgi:hypothetical protein
MMLRRKILGILTAGAVALGGCTTTQITGFLGQVQAAAAQACQFVPTIDTILAIAGSLGFAPATAAAGAVTAVASVICSKVPPPVSAQYKALAPLRAGGPASTAGTINGVPINGWRTH